MIYVIALVFTNWDECWDFYHANKEHISQETFLEVCEPYMVDFDEGED